MAASTIVDQILQTPGMTKSKLSRASGVSRSAIDSYLSGDASPTLRQIERLAHAAGCSVDVTIAQQPTAKPVPESLEAVLEFGELFPPKRRRPLPEMNHVWRREGEIPA